MLASTSRNAFKRVSTSAVHARSPLPSVTGSASVPCRHASQVVGQRPPPRTQNQTTNPPIRNGPYQFQTDTRFRGGNDGTRLARYNMELNNKAANGRIVDMLAIAAQMKADGVQPSITTYNFLLRGCADGRWPSEARAIIEDMEAVGIQPDRQAMHHLLQSVENLSTDAVVEVLNQMHERGMEPDEITFDILIRRSINGGNFERALQWLMHVEAQRMQPTLQSAQLVIKLACETNYARLALDLANSFEDASVRRLDSDVWMTVLGACSHTLWADGVQQAWAKVVTEMGISPDEGICMNVLHTSARHGLPELGNDALRVLASLRVTWKEHHFAPLVEAFCRADRLSEAFEVLAIMRAEKVPPTAETAAPLFGAITKDLDAVDGAFGVLDALHAAQRPVDVTALNVVVQAAVALGDLQRAVGSYKAAPGLGVAPDAETFNLLLAGCIGAAHRALGDQLLEEMKAAGVAPDARTYERLIVLCLTQENYEDAFFYLEEMKTAQHIPPIEVYEAIVRRCVAAQDTRYDIAVQEMRECGYEVSPALRQFIKEGGAPEGAANAPQEPETTLEDKKRMFLEG